MWEALAPSGDEGQMDGRQGLAGLAAPSLPTSSLLSVRTACLLHPGPQAPPSGWIIFTVMMAGACGVRGQGGGMVGAEALRISIWGEALFTHSRGRGLRRAVNQETWNLTFRAASACVSPSHLEYSSARSRLGNYPLLNVYCAKVNFKHFTFIFLLNPCNGSIISIVYFRKPGIRMAARLQNPHSRHCTAPPHSPALIL